MNIKHEANFWRRFAEHGEELGYQVAAEAESIANFIDSLELVVYDTYHTRNFDNYVEGLVRGYQTNEQDYDNCSISTTLDLHFIRFYSMGLHNFIWYLKHNTIWKDRIEYAYFTTKVLA